MSSRVRTQGALTQTEGGENPTEYWPELHLAQQPMKDLGQHRVCFRSLSLPLPLLYGWVPPALSPHALSTHLQTQIPDGIPPIFHTSQCSSFLQPLLLDDLSDTKKQARC